MQEARPIVNYITYDAWWDTDKTILPDLCKECRVRVFVSDPPAGGIIKYAVKEDCGFDSLTVFKSKYRDRNPLKLFRSLKFARSIIRAARVPGSVNILSVGNNPYLLLPLLAALPPERTIIVTHNYREHVDRRHIPDIKQLFYKRFRHFMFYSQSQVELFARDYPAKDRFCLRMPLKDFGRPSHGRLSPKVTFLFFGLIRDYKRLDLFLEAAAKCSGEKARFIVAGRCDNPQKYQLMAQKVADVTCRFDFIPDSEVPDYFADADFLVLPYADSTQSGPLLIALNYATPVIASSLPAFRDFITDGEDGFIMAQHSADCLAGIFNKILTLTKEQRSCMKQKAVALKNKYEQSCGNRILIEKINNLI